MDATQVVAGLVVAQVEELATGIEAAVRARHVAVGFVAARFRERHDLVHPREHDDLFGAEYASCVARESERVADGGAQRPELEAAALIGRQPVRGACRLGGFERREQEARRAPAAVERVRHGDGREPPGRLRLDRHVDAAVDADLEALTQVALGDQFDRVETDPQRGHREQQEGRAGEHRQLHEPEDARSDVQPGRRTEQGPTAFRQHRAAAQTG